MKFYTKWAHRIIRVLRLENLCIALGHYFPLFTRLLPLPEEYSVGSFVTVRRNGVIFRIDRSDYMQWHLYAGMPEASWRKAASIVKPGSVILDIGANCGQFCLPLAAEMHKRSYPVTIHAFEPNPEIFRLLQANCALNPAWNATIICHALALGKEKGTISFAYNPANSGGGSVSYVELTGQHAHRVTIDRLDRVAEDLSLSSVDFIKIDVEGFEPEVLIGGEAVIRKYHPWLFVEVTPGWFRTRGHTLDEIIHRFAGWNYELWGEQDQAFIPYLKNEQVFRSLHQFNLLAKPSDFGR